MIAAAAVSLGSVRPRSASRLLLLLLRRGGPRHRSPTPFRWAPPPSSTSPTLRLFCSKTLAADVDADNVPAPDAVSAAEKVREFKKRLRISDVKGGPDEGLDWLGQRLTVRGWVRTCRVQSSVTFIEVNDGSCLSNMQCVMSSEAEGYDQVEAGIIATGVSVRVDGVIVSSQGTKQKVELKVERLVMIGISDPSNYPIQKKRASREFLRTVAHLRPRTNTFGAVTRVRNALAYATHKFFQDNGFVWISSPIITASDCEGAGEQFCVTTLIPGTQEGTDCPINTIPATKDGTIDWSQIPRLGLSEALS